ncbi:sensor histidine kinase [Polaribacter sp. R77954]|uniref:sensor histidine kinase n=1 Tax=Polaribacter sp. R77954 TaxID=3093870 RepID=UPI0037C540AA
MEVIDYGLDQRLENNLELAVFRIIQELITNILKHAEAKNATINISLYDKNLNIIVEDDGKGFDIKKVNLNSGMGISSIKTRVEHLKGSFTVDATLGKGSSILIDIPIT